MLRDKVNIELVVSSQEVRMNELSDFRVGIDVHNDGTEEHILDISNIELLVNKQRSYAWDLAVQNGTIINMKIPAGKHETVMWPLGNALFTESGKYVLKLVWGDVSEEKNILVEEPM